MDERRNPDFIVPGTRARRVVCDDDSAERRVDQHLRAVALLVGVVKELRDDDSFFIRDVDAGIGDAFEKRIFTPDQVVQDSVSANDFGVDVGEQAIGNILLFAELAQDFLIVVRDRIDLDSGGLEFLEGVAQLTELRPTRRSPNRRSIENDD